MGIRGAVGVEWSEGDEGGAEVADLGEDFEQLCLVGHVASQGGGAVRFVSQSQIAEPGRPAGGEEQVADEPEDAGRRHML